MTRMMLKAAIVLMVLCSTQFSLYSQLGVKMGLQRTGYEEMDTFSLKSYKIGVFYAFHLGSRVSLQPELYFSNFGSQEYGNDRDTGDIVKQTLSYIEFPLLVKYTVPLGSRLRPVVFGGGYFSFRVSKNIFGRIIDLAAEDYNPPFPYLIYIPYAGVDSGLVMGIGLEHTGRQVDIHFDLRVNLGISDVYGGASDITKRNHSLALMVGVSFGKGVRNKR